MSDRREHLRLLSVEEKSGLNLLALREQSAEIEKDFSHAEPPRPRYVPDAGEIAVGIILVSTVAMMLVFAVWATR